MADTLPSIHVTNPHPTLPRQSSLSQVDVTGFTDAVEEQAPPSRQTTTDAPALSPSSEPDRAGISQTRSLGQPRPNGDTTERPLSSGSFDPVSQEIYERTGNTTALAASQRTRTSDSLSLTFNSLSIESTDPRPSTDSSRFDLSKSALRDKKKGATFLARFIGNKKREEHDEVSVDSFEPGDERPEGAEAELFYQPCDNMSYAPRHRPPPPYVKMRSRYKKEREFNRMFLAQQLRDFSTSFQADERSISSSQAHRKRHAENGRAVWAVEVSKDGKYLASAGQDHLIRIWPVLSSQQDRTQFSIDEEAHMSEGQKHLSAPVFRNQPLRTFTGHTGDVLSLSWSKNNFLLSSSTDKTVRLWHASRSDCLCAFKHGDFVTSVAFHPRDDRFFLAGSLDCKLRLWSIPDKAVAYWNQAPDMITSVAFTPDGKQAIAGTLTGFCLFYETESLRYQTQLHVKSRTGKNAKGSKITGIKAMHIPTAGGNRSSSSLAKMSDVKILITSNDSRLRLYNLRDKSLEMKFKGHVNLSSQIHASFSDDGRYVISGSEDKKVYIWSTSTTNTTEINNSRKDHWPVETFEAHNANTTCAMFLPQRTRQHLSASEDPIYDICNPPPVKLVSRSEAADVAFTSVRHSISIEPASPHETAPTVRPSIDSFRRISESTNNGYLGRSAHPNGNIFVAASTTGYISVFRQDCGWRQRNNADPSAFTHASDTSSIKRVGSNIVRRSSLSVARNGSLSRTNSATSNRSGLRQSSYGSVHGPMQTAQNRDGIVSWRQSISGTSVHSIDKSSPILSVADSSAGSPALPQMRAGGRSSSPLKSFGFAKRASALVPGRHAPNHDRSPTRPGATPFSPSSAPPTPHLDGAMDIKPKASNSSIQITPPEEKLGVQPDIPRGESYWREDAYFDQAKQQLTAPPRSIKRGSSTATSSRSGSYSPTRKGAVARPAYLSVGGSSAGSSVAKEKLADSSALPEIQRKLTAFSELSDAE